MIDDKTFDFVVFVLSTFNLEISPLERRIRVTYHTLYKNNAIKE